MRDLKESDESSERSNYEDKFEKVQEDVKKLSVAEKKMKKYQKPEVVQINGSKKPKTSDKKKNGQSSTVESETGMKTRSQSRIDHEKLIEENVLTLLLQNSVKQKTDNGKRKKSNAKHSNGRTNPSKS